MLHKISSISDGQGVNPRVRRLVSEAFVQSLDDFADCYRQIARSHGI
ncbi:hypothetical protein [Klebsiella aerogenes EA1509E]|nr:hypothetical protein [Klebsiella aerogenes EA1509E]